MMEGVLGEEVEAEQEPHNLHVYPIWWYITGRVIYEYICMIFEDKSLRTTYGGYNKVK